ncbi:MAG: type II secretion system protein GspN [Myxococcaceae bacterium]|nr:type II secretion system protein GspN [Myxococcaceae bacterium]
MPTKNIALWKRITGYAAFSVLALIISFLLTFNYELFGERLKQEADNNGWYLTFSSVGPGFFSVKAKGLKITKKLAPGQEAAPEPLVIDSISVRPTLLPPGVKVSGDAFDGSFGFTVNGFALLKMALAGPAAKKDVLGNANVNVALDDIDLSSPSIKGYSGLQLAGRISGAAALEMPVAGDGTGADLSQASGTVTVDTKAMALNGGTLSLALPMFGPEPTPMDMPKIVLGDVTGKVKFDKGVGTVEEFKGKSTDVELAISGTMKLAKRMEYSEPNLEIRFKTDPEFVKRLGMIGGALAMVPPDPKDANWRMGRLTGNLGRPRFP